MDGRFVWVSRRWDIDRCVVVRACESRDRNLGRPSSVLHRLRTWIVWSNVVDAIRNKKRTLPQSESSRRRTEYVTA